MSITILYRHPERPEEAGITIVADQTQAQAMIKRLEQRGFRVEKITATRYTSTGNRD